VTDSVLDLMKFVLLALLYAFFARVLWAVWTEVRTPKMADGAHHHAAGSVGSARHANAPNARTAATAGTTRPAGVGGTAPAPRPGGVATSVWIVEPEHLSGRSLRIDGDITIGRHDQCTITLADDSFVSGHHARVFVDDGQPMVEDLNSTNGSFHNGARFGGIRLLSAGDTLRFGSLTLEVR
jgi:hypothetical protein